MSYIEDNLLPNEKIHLTAKISPAIFLSPVFVFVISILVFGFSLSQASKQGNTASIFSGFLPCISGAFFLQY